MLQQTIYILDAVRTENGISALGTPPSFGLERTHKSQISAPLAPSIFSSFLNEGKPIPKSPRYKNNLCRIRSLRGNGKKRSTRFREEESFRENIQNLCTKKKTTKRCIFCYTYTPHIYILHTRTHTHAPLGFNPLKKYESSSSWSI